MKHLLSLCGIVLLVALLLLPSFALGQDPPAMRPWTREEKARMDRVAELSTKGRKLFESGKAREAIAPILESIEISKTLGNAGGGGYYLLAQCYTALGEDLKAIDSYRNMFTWYAPGGDIQANGPPQVRVAMDYAIALARQGREEDAKRLYYYGLRSLNPDGDIREEPIPFVVVFDEDANGEVWEFDLRSLEAAALMAKAIESMGGEMPNAEAAGKMMPRWMYPPLYRAFIKPNHKDADDLFKLARSLAKTEAERQTVDRVRTDHIRTYSRNRIPKNIILPNPFLARKSLAILERSRKDLAAHHGHLVRAAPANAGGG